MYASHGATPCGSSCELADLLGESPDGHGRVGLVSQRMESSRVRRPVLACQVRPDAGSVTPGFGSDAVAEAAFEEVVAQSGLSPTSAVVRSFVDADQERRRDEEPSGRLEHRQDIPPGAIRPEQVLENLLSDDEIELLVERRL